MERTWKRNGVASCTHADAYPIRQVKGNRPSPSPQRRCVRGGSWGGDRRVEPEPCKYVRAACAGKEGEAFQGPRAWSLGSLFLEGRPRFARAGRFAMSLHDADNKNVQC